MDNAVNTHPVDLSERTKSNLAEQLVSIFGLDLSCASTRGLLEGAVVSLLVANQADEYVRCEGERVCVAGSGRLRRHPLLGVGRKHRRLALQALRVAADV